MTDLAAARAPGAALDAALYDSHYLTAVDPAGGRAVWLRHTSLKRPGSAARPTLWLTVFDRAAPAPRALRVTAPEALPDRGTAWVRSGFGTFGPGGTSGAAKAGPSDVRRGIAAARWELSWRGCAPELPYLPAHWLYDRPLPRSGGVALVPTASLEGWVACDGDAPIELSGWEGMVGHNWGSEHPEQWSWLHVSGLGDDRRGWLDLVLARVRLGPLLTPWIASGGLSLDGRWHRAARGRVSRRVAGEETVVAVGLAGRARLALRIRAPATATVDWDYANPHGAGRQVSHCTIADATLRIKDTGGTRELAVAGRFAVEHGAPSSPSRRDGG